MIRLRVGPHDCLVEIAEGASLRVDRLGRWLTARVAGEDLLRRVLDGAVVVQRDPREPPEEVADVRRAHERVLALARECRRRLSDPGVAVALAGEGACREAALPFLDAALTWTPESLSALGDRFTAAYDEVVAVLPPDRYRDVVFLPATGCPYARCSFCAFYRGHPFVVKDREAFTRHVNAVLELLGPALALRTGVFLGSASALSLADDKLLATMAEVTERVGVRPRGFAAFWDPDHAPARDHVRWRSLQRAGLRSAYVGLETGMPALRGSIGKSEDVESVVAAVRGWREAGQEAGSLRTGVVVLAGIGGPDAVEEHLSATAAAVGAMALGRADVVYVSPLREAMEAAALKQAAQDLVVALKAVTAARIAPYAMEAFRYFA